MKITTAKWIFFAFVILNANLILAQESEPFMERKSEIGINCTKILGNVLSLTDKDPSVPYAIFYAYHAKKITLRLGLGAKMANSQSQDLTIPTFPVIKTINDRNLNARFTLERRSTITERFAVGYGLDVLLDEISSVTESGDFFFRNENTLNFGGGPAFRVIFKVNKRIYLTTETSLIGKYGIKKEQTKLGSDPLNVYNSNPTGLNLNLPTTLFVGFNF
jgi:hypothetical protein